MSDDPNQTAQLARTLLGHSATAEAARLARAESPAAARGAGDWLLRGVVWQQCRECLCVQYPPRPLCSRCLAEALEWSRGSGNAGLLAATTLHVSFNDFYRRNAPWPCGLAVHEAGPVFYVFLESDALQNEQRVELFTAPDVADEAVTLAVKPGPDSARRAAALARRLR